MHSIGIVRKLDELNRIVIPRELCRTFDLEQGQPMEIFTEGDTIIIKKYVPGCIFCGDASDLMQYKGKNICLKCAMELKK